MRESTLLWLNKQNPLAFNKTIKLKNSRSNIRYIVEFIKERNTVLCFRFSVADVLSGFEAQHVYLPKSCYSNH